MTKRGRNGRRLPFKINLGIIIFILIFIYLIVNIISYLIKDHVSSYEVTSGQIVEKIKCTGIALRNEEVINADTSGYANYYVRDGARVGKDDVIYSMDSTGKVMDYISSNFTSDDTLDDESYNEIKSEISAFNNNFSKENFMNVYSFKYQIENDVIELTNDSFMKNLKKALKEAGMSDSLEKKVSPSSGIVSFHTDGFEGMATGAITAECFNIGKYNRTQLKTEEKIEQGNPVYKMTIGEDWHIVIQLDKNRYTAMQEKASVNVKILKDDLSIPATVRTYQNAKGEYLADLRIKSYMIRYINERYLDVEITLKSNQGLKIPRTAIVEKECYKIPVEYIIDNNGLNGKMSLLTSNKNGDTIKKDISPSIYRIDYNKENEPTYCYVNPNDIPTGGILLSATGEHFAPTDTKKLMGVYNMNMGYATFRPVYEEDSNEDFVIVKAGQDGSIATYDFIVLNSKTVKEDQLVS